MRFDSLIFDIDGTMWDSTGAIAEAFSLASAEFPYGKKHFTKERIKAEVGRPLNEIFLHLYPELLEIADEKERADALARVNEVSTEYEYNYLREHGGDLFPELKETLAWLAERLPLYIVSNCEKGYIEIMTESSGITQYFQDWLCYGDTQAEKDVTMKMLADKHGLKAPAYIGDILPDALSSQRAGIAFIWAAYGFGEVEKDLYCEKIDEFRVLKDIIIR